MQDIEVMIAIGERSWSFHGAEIDGDSWEAEWSSDGKLRLHDSIGNVVEETEVGPGNAGRDSTSCVSCSSLTSEIKYGKRNFPLEVIQRTGESTCSE
jgi:hypothetical protein